jgi:hypothetical protein
MVIVYLHHTFYTSINPNIPYTDGQMYMSGRLLQSFKCDSENQKADALNIIHEKKDLFIAEIKISCPKGKKSNSLTFHLL